MIERADIVDKATDIVEQMLNDVVAVPPTGHERQPRGRPMSGSTTARSSPTAARTRASSRAVQIEPYREIARRSASPMTNTVTDFTTGNAIVHCMPPGELGGDA